MIRLIYILIAVVTLSLFGDRDATTPIIILEQDESVLTESMPRSDHFRAGSGSIALPTGEGSVSQQRTSQSVARRVATNLLSRKATIESNHSPINRVIVRRVVPVPAGDLAAKIYYIFQLRHIII